MVTRIHSEECKLTRSEHFLSSSVFISALSTSRQLTRLTSLLIINIHHLPKMY
eukprot:c36788_g1_i1 orf=67-225(-)